ncbi:MAG: SpoIID/LytB domain-containing protein [Clostridia bacterium]|nr:SpoIID/LytB domain-containing protein [Clostridia bacterium]
MPLPPYRRQQLLAAGVLLAACLLVPKKEQPPLHNPGRPSPSVCSTPAPAVQEDVFRILDTSTGEILTVTARDFLPGAVATEMTLYMHEEALKAQAVASYTHYAWQRAQNKENDYDFTCSTKDWQIYVTPQDMQKRWGEKYSEYMEILNRVADAAAGLCLTYGGEPICAAYFAISSGHTEEPEDVWGGDLPCLAAVASPGDVYAEGYLSTAAFSPQELAEAAGVPFTGDAAGLVHILSRSASGGVTEVRVGDAAFTGSELRARLGLRSANFTAEYTGGQWMFTVKGWGHGVGMSQAGADAMANQGFTFEEILAWYYPGAELTRVF